MRVNRGNRVKLGEIDRDNFFGICQLSVTDVQRKYVDSVAESLAEANLYDSAWYRSIIADEIPVGFVMLDDRPEEARYYLWRLMIDQKYQGLGFGRQAINLIADYVRTRPNATQLLTSVMQVEGGPQKFYENVGFRLTGEYPDRSHLPNQSPEAFMVLPLT